MMEIEIITVKGRNVPVVDLREMHKALRAKGDYYAWIEAIRFKYEFRENVEIFESASATVLGAIKDEFYLRLDVAIDLARVSEQRICGPVATDLVDKYKPWKDLKTDKTAFNQLLYIEALKYLSYL